MANGRLWHLAQQLRLLTSTQAEARALWNDQAGAQIRSRYLRPHEQRAAHQVEQLTEHDRALDGLSASVRAARVHYEEARVAGELVTAEIQEAQYAVSVTHDFIRRGLTNEGRAAQLQEQAVASAEQANAIGGAAPGEHGQTRAPIAYTSLPRRQQSASGGMPLTAGWRGTNMSVERSFAYHYGKHSYGHTPEQYTQDARAFAANPPGIGKPAHLRDDPPGTKSGTTYRTPGGGPSATLDENGAVVTFRYH
ncbi:MAG: hypothetical protein QOJ63_1877 [Solirubrobacteraceae bacterium]|nr:hypothetical protein [Solirubrobacteraceae bacterium]